jgi:exodeoxyribonuclease V alpha subunit
MIATHFARFLSQWHEPRHDDFFRLVESLSVAVENGSSCLDLNNVEDLTKAQCQGILACDRDGSAVGSPGRSSPLILTPEGRLYLQRYYLHEKKIFDALDARARQDAEPVPRDLLKRVSEAFGCVEDNDQAAAALCALRQRVTILSGGPGTGKTYTAARILRLLRERGAFDHAADCLLLAPTGKAAERLRQSIESALKGDDDTELPRKTATIHRALGYRHGSIEFLHNVDNPLAARVVIVDETSMVSLPLMARLLDALRPDARLILLGDKNQLASIQVGTVLADLMEIADSGSHPLAKCAVTLRKSHRNQGSIHRACEAIRSGDADKAWQEITGSAADAEGAIVHDLPPDNVEAAIGQFVNRHWLPALRDRSLTPLQKLRAIDRFRILTPTHQGRFGVEAINRIVERFLAANAMSVTGTWFHGRSIIVQRNDYGLNIFNGDTGLALESGNGKLAVCFAGSSRSEDGPSVVNDQHDRQENETAEECYRQVTPARLPEVKSAWALTIHRTQGSEYDEILLIIPPTRDSKILSRELLYTGLSRARTKATLWCDEAGLRDTVATTVRRASGLPELFINQATG